VGLAAKETDGLVGIGLPALQSAPFTKQQNIYSRYSTSDSALLPPEAEHHEMGCDGMQWAEETEEVQAMEEKRQQSVGPYIL
jgi:hypothetical protein